MRAPQALYPTQSHYQPSPASQLYTGEMGVSLGIQALSPPPPFANTGGCYASQSLLAVGMIIVSQARLSRGRVWPARLAEDGRAAGGLRTCLALVNEEEANFLNSSSRLLKD